MEGGLTDIGWSVVTVDMAGCGSQHASWTAEAGRPLRCVRVCVLCIPVGSVQRGAVFCIHLEFLEDNTVQKQTLNCIMLQLFPKVSIMMEICMSKTSITAELIVPHYPI